jgi:uncharacterized membrane protein YfcA
MQIQTIVSFTSIAAAITHFFHGNLIWSIIIPLSLGNIIGGFVGGIILQKTERLSGQAQKNIMRASLLFGIVMSAWMIFK